MHRSLGQSYLPPWLRCLQPATAPSQLCEWRSRCLFSRASFHCVLDSLHPGFQRLYSLIFFLFFIYSQVHHCFLVFLFLLLSFWLFPIITLTHPILCHFERINLPWNSHPAINTWLQKLQANCSTHHQEQRFSSHRQGCQMLWMLNLFDASVMSDLAGRSCFMRHPLRYKPHGCLFSSSWDLLESPFQSPFQLVIICSEQVPAFGSYQQEPPPPLWAPHTPRQLPAYGPANQNHHLPQRDFDVHYNQTSVL